MPSTDALVSICLPTRNGASRLPKVVQSIQAQDHANLEIIISDNASTDSTEDLCRELAAQDERIVYVRRLENIGLLNNFIETMRQARGPYARWVSDDDWIAPSCLSRCLQEFEADERLILVTMGIEYIGDDGTSSTAEYLSRQLASDNPIERLTEMLRLLNTSYQLIDPLYGLLRRKAVTPIPRRNMLREDEIFAAKLALAGPWAHVREVLAQRGWRYETRPQLARRLGVPSWTARAATTLQCQELLRCVGVADLEPDQRRQARAAVLRWYVGRQQRTMARRGRRIAQIAGLSRRKPSSVS